MKTHVELREFWEGRLGADWTESGVGHKALGRSFNTWMYKVRSEVFLREVRRLGADLPGSRVLDVGSGTGFYVRHWQRLGAVSITGCDLTDAAVERLGKRFPDVGFLRLDIAEPGDALEPGSFDLVSAMDMLFHITDDDRYRAALEAISGALRPGGLFILSDNFLHRPREATDHQVNRTVKWITEAMDAAGFDVVRRVPMLYLMNAQVDAPFVWRKFWGGILRAATLTEATGQLAGAALYPLERRLVRSRRESPTTEMMICRRR